jgi:hypothetical protein
MSGLSTPNMEANVLTEQQIKEGWIAWFGDMSCPVRTGETVEIIMRSGKRDTFKISHPYGWQNMNDAADIIAYRPATPIKDERHG